MYDVYEIRKDFPVLSASVKPNVFLDSAASAQKPYAVINRLNDIYSHTYANVHRGIYRLSEEITAAYEKAREIVCKFINAASSEEIVFTRNATEAVNLVAATWGRHFLKPGDEVLISQAEHHANLVPWQMLRDEIGFTLKVFPIADDGSYLEEEYLKALSPRTKLVSVTGMSNVLGTIFPVKKMAAQAHANGALFMLDACQYVVHQPVDVQDLDCDFMAFSGHKTYGPTGIGVLYGKYNLLDSMPPYQCGGDMVDVVTYDKTTFMPPPARFEAGTPASVQAIGLGEALNYMNNLGMKNIKAHEDQLTAYARGLWENEKGLTLVGTAKEKGGVFSFVVDGIHPQDLAFVLDKEGIAIRVGHHCAEPLVHRMGYETVARASFGLYTTKEDIDALLPAVRKARKMLL